MMHSRCLILQIKARSAMPLSSQWSPPWGTVPKTLLRTSRALTALHIHVMCSVGDEYFNMEDFWSEVIQSLSLNTTVRQLSITSGDIDGRKLQAIASVFKTGHNIHTLDLSTQPLADYGAFVRSLYTGIKHNYAVLNVSLAGGVDGDLSNEWFVVRDTARRNSDLLARAAEFASGVRRNRALVSIPQALRTGPVCAAVQGSLLVVLVDVMMVRVLGSTSVLQRLSLFLLEEFGTRLRNVALVCLSAAVVVPLLVHDTLAVLLVLALVRRLVFDLMNENLQ
ncbi:hypothetical protein V5799_010481, partial [Amblyomma americanum]